MTVNFFYATKVLKEEARRIRAEQNPLDRHCTEDAVNYFKLEANAQSCEIGAQILDAVHSAAMLIKGIS